MAVPGVFHEIHMKILQGLFGGAIVRQGLVSDLVQDITIMMKM